jgi:adenine-specific DNA-methyltransferase
MTVFHSKYIGHALGRRGAPGDTSRIAAAVAAACVDLNPHQVDAALFALRSPLSRGVLLADEVGLGKTIEAGLVIAQRWAEGRRRILIIVPSNLRRQWHQELAEKFFLPSEILEARSFYNAGKTGGTRPFEPNDAVVICSYQFARNKAEDIARTPWDLVVIDEAHRLRNVWKPGNVVATALKDALAGRPKILLTATPLQNSLLELFGLVSLIDDHVFGDLGSFRERFMGPRAALPELQERLNSVCHRTLRRQVQAYVPYTRRHALVEQFSLGVKERQLYDAVASYLSRDELQALPAQQRALTTMVLRKLLASSSFAIAGALETMSKRLLAGLTSVPSEDLETFDETMDEWGVDPTADAVPDQDAAAIEAAELQEMATFAASIGQNAKGDALLSALKVAFAKASELGSAQKALIFTESRRTQDYLLALLRGSPWGDEIVLFNGSNTDPDSRKIYHEWLERHRGTDRISGSRTADMRQALVDRFRERGKIMIATEAGAEGINLQFCALVVNYDLPWNPQRIEQRIGRCHRYGQKHDVVVVNFLNRDNAADQRVHQLLAEKFSLFEGVFGASDEVLGAIGSGVDFERRVADIYQRCRHPEDISAAFDALQAELAPEIDAEITQTRTKILEHFDDEVRERLKATDADTHAVLDRYERDLMRLTAIELGEHASWQSVDRFTLLRTPKWGPDIPPGAYRGPRTIGDGHIYRPGHPLAQAAIQRACSRDLAASELRFDLTRHPGKISALERYMGQSGWTTVELLSVEAGGEGQDWLLHAAVTDDGQTLPTDAAERMWTVDGVLEGRVSVPDSAMSLLTDEVSRSERSALDAAQARHAALLAEEERKLDNWADDLKIGLERDIREIDRLVADARRLASASLTLEQKLEAQKAVRALEQQRNQKRKSLFDAQDEIDIRRGDLIAGIEARLTAKISKKQLFMCRWRIE